VKNEKWRVGLDSEPLAPERREAARLPDGRQWGRHLGRLLQLAAEPAGWIC